VEEAFSSAEIWRLKLKVVPAQHLSPGIPLQTSDIS